MAWPAISLRNVGGLIQDTDGEQNASGVGVRLVCETVGIDTNANIYLAALIYHVLQDYLLSIHGSQHESHTWY